MPEKPTDKETHDPKLDQLRLFDQYKEIMTRLWSLIDEIGQVDEGSLIKFLRREVERLQQDEAALKEEIVILRSQLAIAKRKLHDHRP